MIANLQHSDTGTYYCASSFSEKPEFKDGITIIIKGSGLNIPVFIQRPEYHLNQSEGAVRFNCTAHGRAIDQEHGAYQLRTSEKSDPGALYTCFYSLPANNLAVDCAVVTCGHFLKLPQKPPGAEDGYLNLYILSGALAFTIILASFMAVLLCNIYKSQSGRSGGSILRYSDDPTTNEEVLVIYINKNILIAVHHVGISYFLFQQKGHTNEDVLHYAALRTSMTDRPKRQMGAINEECVYGRVKHHR
uniref:Immunoglobulin subtype domain-containing protein n=1 Tax=Takifugu rubripes TaxID=31033 RepID=A0A674PQ78_TAKRU